MEFYFQHEKGFVKCNINEIRWEKYIQNFQNSFFDILTSHRIIKGVTIVNILKIRSHYLLETFPNPLSAPANQQHSKYYYHNIYTILVIFKI